MHQQAEWPDDESHVYPTLENNQGFVNKVKRQTTIYRIFLIDAIYS